jgi:ribokinase
MLDILTVGNALIDAYLTLHDADTHCRLNEESGELCIKAGEKLLLDEAKFLLGGNACNVAVGLSRSGFQAALVAETGNDEFAQKIIKGLQKEGIATDYINQTESAASFAMALNFRNERTLFVDHIERSHHFIFPQEAVSLVYLTSLGKEWEAAYEATVAYCERYGVTLALNPGTPQLKEGLDKLQHALKKCSILFLNRQEAERVISVEPGTQIQDVLLKLHELGPQIIVITDGNNGSYLYDRNSKIYHMGIFDVPVVERTGAGDAYSSGFLTGFLREKPLQTCMQYGTVNAAAVVGKVGAQAGLLSEEAMRNMVEKAALVTEELS